MSLFGRNSRFPRSVQTELDERAVYDEAGLTSALLELANNARLNRSIVLCAPIYLTETFIVPASLDGLVVRGI